MNHIKTNKIGQQYASYLQSKNSTEKKENLFSDEFLKKLESANAGKEGISAARLLDSSSVKGSERPRASFNATPLHLGKPKQITTLQAKRLASYAPHIEAAAKKHNVPVELICGVILQESGAQSKAVSHCGARGLMQLMPQTAKRFGVSNSFDPKQNIDGGTKYLAFLLKRFKGRLDLTLAAYNSGEHNVEKYGNKIPPFRETKNYVPAVLGYTQSMINIFASNKAVQMNSRRA